MSQGMSMLIPLGSPQAPQVVSDAQLKRPPRNCVRLLALLGYVCRYVILVPELIRSYIAKVG